MAVDRDTVKRIAKLARLALEESQLPAMEEELNAMLALVEQLSEVDVEGIPPMTSAVESQLKMRDDVVSDGGYAADLMKNAPASEGAFFVVPKVVE